MANKVLLVTYSWSGTTAKMATALQAVTKATRVDLTVTAGTFSGDMYATSDKAKQQLATGQLPTLTNSLPDLTQYATILVGGPVWSGQVATPVRTFLSQLRNYQGIVAPFYTDAGTPDDYEADFKQLLQGVKVATGLGLTGGQVVHAEAACQTWWSNAQLVK